MKINARWTNEELLLAVQGKNINLTMFQLVITILFLYQGQICEFMHTQSQKTISQSHFTFSLFSVTSNLINPPPPPCPLIWATLSQLQITANI